ncbi:hypothetical protein ACTA71_009551 [Dictyostelium dimigraforme]
MRRPYQWFSYKVFNYHFQIQVWKRFQKTGHVQDIKHIQMDLQDNNEASDNLDNTWKILQLSISQNPHDNTGPEIRNTEFVVNSNVIQSNSMDSQYSPNKLEIDFIQDLNNSINNRKSNSINRNNNSINNNNNNGINNYYNNNNNNNSINNNNNSIDRKSNSINNRNSNNIISTETATIISTTEMMATTYNSSN